MATTYRLNAFTLFLILLAVLVLGYLLNHTWETFMCGCKRQSEGFGTLDGYGEILEGYSLNGKKVVPLYENVYYDPIAKNFVEPTGSHTLRITDRNNNEESHTYSSTTKQVVDKGTGKYTIAGVSGETLTLTGVVTVQQLKTTFKDRTSVNPDQLLEIELSGNTLSNDAIVKSAKVYSIPDTTSLTTASELNGLVEMMTSDSTSNYHRFARVLDADNYVPTDPPSNATSFIYLGKVDSGIPPKYAFLHVPIKSKEGNLTSISFIHVMDLDRKKHIKTFYFNGSEIETNDVQTSILASGYTDLTEVNGENLAFSTSFEDEMNAQSDSNFVVNVDHNTGDKAIKIIVRKKETIKFNEFRAYVTFNTSGSPRLAKIETGSGSGSSSGDDDDSDSEDDSDDYHSKYRQYRRLQSELYGHGGFPSPYYDYDGSPYSDMMLKTEVIPPVCPACPSCPGNGVCNSCGGNGGSGTQGSTNGNKDSAKSLARDLGSGADQFVRDGASGAVNIGRDTVSGTVGLAKDTVSGTGEFVKDSASGVGNFAKDAASGTFGATKEVAGGLYNTASNIVGNTVDLGREIVGGTLNLGRDIVGGVAGGVGQTVNTVAGQNYHNGGYYQSQGGIPNSQMGGYHNSYGGGYMNPQTPQTAGQDPYGYFGAVPSRNGQSNVNYMPVTADFSPFAK